MRQIVLDTETTGLSALDGHRITEIGCVEIIDRKITGNSFQTYINPEREIDEAAARITGLTLGFLQDKPKFSQIVENLFAFVNDAELIIHNAIFDIGFLNNELKLINHSCSDIENEIKVFDTLRLARQLHPGQRNSLDALCKRYKIDNSHRELHGALLDAKILAEVYLAMTAGQTNFMLANDEEINFNQNITTNKNTSFITKAAKLKIVKASAEELLEHEQYLAYIKTKSEIK